MRFLVPWEPPADIATQFPHLEVLFSSGAGVDQFNSAALPPTLPAVHMIEPGIARGMVEYVTHAVLSLRRATTVYRRQHSAEQWRPLPVRRTICCRAANNSSPLRSTRAKQHQALDASA